MIKRLAFGVFTAVVLLGAGCSGDTGPVQPVVSIPQEPMVYADQGPVEAAQMNWAQMFFQAEASNCEGWKMYIHPEMRANVTEDDCAVAFAGYSNVQDPYTIDWETALINAGATEITLNDWDGLIFLEYKKGDNGAWYVNNEFWN